jgi:phage RecT family recombinase
VTAPTISDLMTAAQERIAPFIPKGMSAEQVTQLVYWAFKKNPALLKCDGGSIIHSVVTILDWGLVIGQTAHLVPYRNNGKSICTPVADYKGLAQLMVDSRAVRHVEARAVFENDGFRCVLGLEPVLEHLPVSKAARGAIKGAYCILTLPGGIKVFEYMDIGDIEAIRTDSYKWSREKVGDCPPWYAAKTVVRRTAKLVPTNAKLEKALSVIEADAVADTVVDADGVVVEPAAMKSLPLERAERVEARREVAQPVGAMATDDNDIMRILMDAEDGLPFE